MLDDPGVYHPQKTLVNGLFHPYISRFKKRPGLIDENKPTIPNDRESITSSRTL